VPKNITGAIAAIVKFIDEKESGGVKDEDK
jgi:hypothetical protein